MGSHISRTVERARHPETMPSSDELPTFDPSYGFDAPRKPRVLPLTVEEMESAKIPHKNRDYCADKLMDFLVCRKRVYPFVVRCSHENHIYLQCEYEDHKLRMMEHERERRLRVRQQRLEQAAAA